MSMKKRIVSVVLIICILTAVIVVGQPFFQRLVHVSEDAGSSGKETVHLWYTDDNLTEYLNQMALNFYEEKDIRVEVKLVSGLEYLEQINQASLSEEENTPDLFIISNDSLEKAYLSGLATEVQDTQGILNTQNYSQTALNAVLYQDKMVGYPYYYETSALIYNKTYLEQMARKTVEEEMGIELEKEEEDSQEEEEAVTETDPFAGCDDTVKAAAMEKVDTMIPSTIVDILTFADEYDAPENVESFFKWDVSDIFYNYFFIGNYISVGGDAGFDNKQISIYNSDAIASLKVYQELNQFFSIEADEVDYDKVVNEFAEGKIIFTIATSDILSKLETAKAEGAFPYEYGVAVIPDINAELLTRGMSVTEAIAVNGYSTNKEAANQFAAYLSSEHADSLYDRTHKVAANKNVSYENAWINVFNQEYEKSVPVPKMVETSNFWILLENCFTKVWSGEDANTELKVLSEQIMTQLTGEAYEEEHLDDPEVELLHAEEYEEVPEEQNTEE